MIEKVLIRPKQGFIVRKPGVHFPLKPEGELMKLDNYWKRRLACGDCELVSEKPKAKKAKPKKLVQENLEQENDLNKNQKGVE